MDLICTICAEPWDAWGVNHGDMRRWEARLFKQGAGCPCCEGIKPSNMTEDESLAALQDRLLINPDEEGPSAGLLALADGCAPPKWEAPPPTVLWQCAGCGVQVVSDPGNAYPDGDSGDTELEWRGGQRVHYRRGYARPYGERSSDEEPCSEPPFTIAEQPYCYGCASECGECDTPIFARSDLETDPYDPGYAFPREGRRAVCCDCYEHGED